jgi:hypothetical protein
MKFNKRRLRRRASTPQSSRRAHFEYAAPQRLVGKTGKGLS